MSRQEKKDPFESLDALVEGIQTAHEMRQLLEEIYNWLGPYGRPEIPLLPEKYRHMKETQKLMEAVTLPVPLQIKLQKFFGFDDNE